jgi:hypothetical protein
LWQKVFHFSDLVELAALDHRTVEPQDPPQSQADNHVPPDQYHFSLRRPGLMVARENFLDQQIDGFGGSVADQAGAEVGREFVAPSGEGAGGSWATTPALANWP